MDATVLITSTCEAGDTEGAEDRDRSRDDGAEGDLSGSGPVEADEAWDVRQRAEALSRGTWMLPLQTEPYEPASGLPGFPSEDHWLAYQMPHYPLLLQSWLRVSRELQWFVSGSHIAVPLGGVVALLVPNYTEILRRCAEAESSSGRVSPNEGEVPLQVLDDGTPRGWRDLTRLVVETNMMAGGHSPHPRLRSLLVMQSMAAFRVVVRAASGLLWTARRPSAQPIAAALILNYVEGPTPHVRLQDFPR